MHGISIKGISGFFLAMSGPYEIRVCEVARGKIVE
jgi:hypothetical protein